MHWNQVAIENRSIILLIFDRNVWPDIFSDSQTADTSPTSHAAESRQCLCWSWVIQMNSVPTPLTPNLFSAIFININLYSIISYARLYIL